MTPEELQAIKARAEAATRGPWVNGWATRPLNDPMWSIVESYSNGPYYIYVELPPGGATEEEIIVVAGKYYRRPTSYSFNNGADGGIANLSDAVFIAHARQDVPALIRYIEYLWDVLDQMERDSR